MSNLIVLNDIKRIIRRNERNSLTELKLLVLLLLIGVLISVLHKSKQIGQRRWELVNYEIILKYFGQGTTSASVSSCHVPIKKFCKNCAVQFLIIPFATSSWENSPRVTRKRRGDATTTIPRHTRWRIDRKGITHWFPDDSAFDLRTREKRSEDGKGVGCSGEKREII